MMTGEHANVGDDLAGPVRDGLAVIVGTCGDDNRPAVTRGWGAVAGADGSVVELCVAAPAGSRTLASVRTGRPIAVTFSDPTTYVSVQVKGHVTSVGEPSPEQLARVEAHIGAFGAAVEPFGLTPEFVRSMACDELRAVTVAVETRYDQTPGRGAGQAL